MYPGMPLGCVRGVYASRCASRVCKEGVYASLCASRVCTGVSYPGMPLGVYRVYPTRVCLSGGEGLRVNVSNAAPMGGWVRFNVSNAAPVVH